MTKHLPKRDDDDDDPWDDDDDEGNDLSEDCGVEHACLGEEMTTRGHCILNANHPGNHYCGWCASEF